MAGHAVRLGEDGRLEVVRTAPPEDAAQLRRAIGALRAAAGAGAVDIVSVRDDGEEVELILAFAGRPPTVPMQTTDLARAASALAANLADLHLRREVHGALHVEHVLIDAAGVVRMCGLGHGGDATPADDVLAFGALLGTLLDERDRSATAAALRAARERCCVADPSARPTMAAIAASLASSTTRTRAITAPAHPNDRRRRWPLGAAAAAATVVTAVGVLVPLPRGSRAEPRDATPPTTTTSTSVATATRVWPAPTAATIEGAGATWELGDVDDRTAIGDWNCDGVATPALLERPSGALWVVDAWPTGDEAPARYVTTVTDGIALAVERGPSCDALVVTTEDGLRIKPLLTA